ncbi:hypothetical protein [Sulfurovum sp. NBC37-1]|uniref:hypothetical protein n=1 Tax=Sulfurovum sp. (strain NBC37-1) TaxID=387093 RepID=UPI00015874C2|nr:hypothetical protein [Sulfurovum sp. NBC37-1]BAF71462.1 conserved hypothetical protein [Sulfurovum sp. NBC37-1]
MKQGTIKLGLVTATLLMGSTALMAGGDIAPAEAPVKEDVVKRTLNGNMTLNYKVLPGAVDNIHDLFSEGVFYGRLRMNSFYWHWAADGAPNNAPKEMGLGGSLIYKSAILNGFSFTVGYYGSMNPDFFRPDADEVGFAKAGKDTFSRYKVKTGGGFGLHTLGEGYLEYNNGTVDVKAGRQLFESVFTKSNDTKMIPNTFDGASAAVKIAPKTKARVAWFGAQKLRDHENSHDVITFKDANGESWNNNDDAGKHRGLNYNNFVNAGEDPDHNMYLADITTKYIKNLKLTGSFLQIPGVLQDWVIEAHYKIPLSDSGWAVRPGIREFIQNDDGGGAVISVNGTKNPVNALGKSMIGYSDGAKNSLDSSLFNARLDVLMPDKKGFFRLGYSKVADEADIVAPWRGFPTGGFTRAMAQYNWFSNTETIMLRAVYKFNPTWKASIRYAIQDFDDNKNVPSDSNVIHIDTWTNITQDLQMRMRYGHVSADDTTLKPGSLTDYKKDWSYDEFRLEFNYLF